MDRDFVSQWTELPVTDDVSLEAARTQCHYAIQWLGRLGRVAAVAAPDDSHTSMQWDPNRNALVTQGGDLNLSFSFRDFSLTFKHEDVSDRFSLEGKSESDIRVWLGSHLDQSGLNPAGLDEALPYELPVSLLTSGSTYDGTSAQAGLVYLHGLYRNTAALLRSITQADARALPIRCWPHHFDMAILIAVDEQVDEAARSVGIGMSPGDDNYPMPYFYVTPWPYPDAAHLPPLPEPGHWHTDGWVGAILMASKLQQTADAAVTLEGFVIAARDHAKQLIGDITPTS